jgi:hypothetical protein
VVIGFISLLHFGQYTQCPEKGGISTAMSTAPVLGVVTALRVRALLMAAYVSITAMMSSSSVRSAVMRRPLCAVPNSGNMAMTAGAYRMVFREPRQAMRPLSVHTVSSDIASPFEVVARAPPFGARTALAEVVRNV